jgi:hypothetical protein
MTETASTTVEAKNSTVFANGIKIVGEAVIPGASLLLDGRLGNGVAHALVGWGARIVLGPVGVVLVAADSYSKSVTGKYLWNHLASGFDSARDDFRRIDRNDRHEHERHEHERHEPAHHAAADTVTPDKTVRAKT